MQYKTGYFSLIKKSLIPFLYFRIQLYLTKIINKMTVRKSLAISFAEKYSVMGIQFLSSLVLARLLTPEEIGIFSVGTLVVGFAHMLRDFGISNYIIQEKELTVERLRTAFSVTLALAWIAALILYFLSKPLAIFYKEQGIETVIIILSISFLFIPFSSTIFGLLRRELNFAKLYWINLISAIVNAYVSIVLTLYGYGFVSLAWGAVANVLTTTCLTILMRPTTSQFVPSFLDFKRIFSFGSKSSLTSLAIEFGNNSAELIIGRVMSFDAVGYFSKATGLATLFNKLITSAIHTVAIPYFAQKNRETGELNKPYLHTVDLLLGISWPFYLFLSFFSLEIIGILFGSQWDNSAPLATILCAGFALKLIPAVGSWVLTSIGAVHENMIGRMAWELIIVSLIIPASFISLKTICYAFIIGNIFGIFIYCYYLKKNIQLSIKNFLHILIKNLCITLFVGVTLFISYQATHQYVSAKLPVMITASVPAILYWLILIYATNHPLSKEIDIFIKRFSLFRLIEKSKSNTRLR